MIRPVSLSLLLLACLAGAATTAFGQATADSAAAHPATVDSTASLPATPPPAPATPASPASLLGPNSPTPSRPHLVTGRPGSLIRTERDQMAVIASNADNDLLEAKKQQVEARGTVEIKKREIDTIAARVKAAKQAKDDATRTAFDAERKRQESMRDFFSRLVDVADAAIDEAQARGEYGRAAMRALDAELQLVGRVGLATYDADPALFKLEQQFLDAARLRGAAEEKLANRAQTLADRRLRVYRQWADYLGGR